MLAAQVKELDPDNPLANKTVQRLTPIVDDRREKMKDEMLGEGAWTGATAMQANAAVISI